MMTLMAAALVAAQPAPMTAAHPQHGATPPGQAVPMQHDGKMKDCCKDCCKDMDAKHDGHGPDERGQSGS